MQFTRATEYAALGILHLATLEEGAVVSTEEIAQQRSVPAKFLAGVTRDLVRAGIISAHRGRNGGVSLARRPEDVTLRDVYEAVEGKMQVAECMRPNPNCRVLGDCALQGVWAELQDQLLGAMEKVTFSELAERERVLRASDVNAV
jgi:Rrf2 family iron-sulfur cluster assembly transcriptional regulator